VVERTRAEEAERDVQVPGWDGANAVQVALLPRCERPDRVVRELQAAEKTDPLITGHASEGGATCLSRLRDETAHEVECRRHRPTADRLAVAGQVEPRLPLAGRSGDGEVDEPDRLLLASSV